MVLGSISGRVTIENQSKTARVLQETALLLLLRDANCLIQGRQHLSDAQDIHI